MNNEPVALTQVEIMNALTLGIPLYTHPAKFKELTDAEIMESCHAYHYTYNPDYLGFAREILRKAQEK